MRTFQVGRRVKALRWEQDGICKEQKQVQYGENLCMKENKRWVGNEVRKQAEAQTRLGQVEFYHGAMGSIGELY